MVSAARNEELGGRQLLSRSKVAQKEAAMTENIPKVQQDGRRTCCIADDGVKGKHFLQTQIS